MTELTQELTNRPLVLLDVDGVISPLPRHGYDGSDTITVRYCDGTTRKMSARWSMMAYDDKLSFDSQYCFIPGIGMSTAVNHYIMEQICYIMQEDVADFQWLTTWDGIADSLRRLEHAIFESEFDEDKVPVLPITPRDSSVSGGSIYTKLDAVKKLHAENPNRKIIWVDDDAKNIDEELIPANVKVISPNELVGLTMYEIDQIRKNVGIKTWAQLEAEYDAEVQAELAARHSTDDFEEEEL